jgi:Spy/CpxP family protein refolding chaperone
MAKPALLLAVIVCLGVAPVRMYAQTSPPRRGKWWQAEDVQHQLGLTSAQVDAIEKVWRQDLSERIHLRQELEALEAKWNEELARGEIDDADAERLIDRMEDARMRHNTARTLVLFEMYRVLTPDQRASLTEVLATRGPAAR